MQLLLPLLLGAFLVAAAAANLTYRVGEQERLVVFRLGRPIRVEGPGVQFVFPFVERGLIFDITDDFDARTLAGYEAQLEEGRA
jgi:regulator of protease activity HflC (stomatin/prohibitin superfamily)